MKQQDIAVIIIIVFFAGIFSFILSNKFFSPANDKREAETVSAITADFIIPDDKYFNDRSINPTRTIEIGDTNNPNPFEDEKL